MGLFLRVCCRGLDDCIELILRVILMSVRIAGVAIASRQLTPSLPDLRKKADFSLRCICVKKIRAVDMSFRFDSRVRSHLAGHNKTLTKTFSRSEK